MGKAIIRVDARVVLTGLLRLTAYEVVQVKAAPFWPDGPKVLTFEVESPELPDEPTTRTIEPLYEQMTDEQGRTWYRLVRVDSFEE